MPHCGRRPVLAIVHIIAGHLPYPPVNDEPVPPQQQDARPGLVQNRNHGAPTQSEHVLRELGTIGQLNVRQADPDVRVLVYQPLAADNPAVSLGAVSRHNL